MVKPSKALRISPDHSPSTPTAARKIWQKYQLIHQQGSPLLCVARCLLQQKLSSCCVHNYVCTAKRTFITTGIAVNDDIMCQLYANLFEVKTNVCYRYRALSVQVLILIVLSKKKIEISS